MLRAVIAQFNVDQARNLSKLTKAQKELTKATKKLNEAQIATIEAIKQLSSGLQEPYRSKSTDVDDVLASLREGAADVTAFGAQVKQLKALGLSQDAIDQITAVGAVNGGELAEQIIAGGQGLVDARNRANNDLVTASNALGLTATRVKGGKGFATGGYTGDVGVSTPVGVVHGREYVVNAAATAANRGALDAINYGRAQINEHRFIPAYAGASGSRGAVDQRSWSGGDVHFHGDVVDPDRLARQARSRQRDNLTMGRLSVPV